MSANKSKSLSRFGSGLAGLLILLVIIVQLVQWIGDRIGKAIDHR